jgi:hypothetical protein
VIGVVVAGVAGVDTVVRVLAPPAALDESATVVVVVVLVVVGVVVAVVAAVAISLLVSANALTCCGFHGAGVDVCVGSRSSSFSGV